MPKLSEVYDAMRIAAERWPIGIADHWADDDDVIYGLSELNPLPDSAVEHLLEHG